MTEMTALMTFFLFLPVAVVFSSHILAYVNQPKQVVANEGYHFQYL
jgi:hypothetical protein